MHNWYHLHKYTETYSYEYTHSQLHTTNTWSPYLTAWMQNAECSLLYASHTHTQSIHECLCISYRHKASINVYESHTHTKHPWMFMHLTHTQSIHECLCISHTHKTSMKRLKENALQYSTDQYWFTCLFVWFRLDLACFGSGMGWPY